MPCEVLRDCLAENRGDGPEDNAVTWLVYVLGIDTAIAMAGVVLEIVRGHDRYPVDRLAPANFAPSPFYALSAGNFDSI